MKIRRVALIGLGAIGSYLASNLGPCLGDDFAVIADGDRGERIRRDGIEVNGTLLHFQVLSSQEKSFEADLVIVITKMTQLSGALESIRNFVGPHTMIMTPLNGVESEAVAAKVYGEEKIIWSLARASVVKQGSRVSFNPAVSNIELGEKNNPVVSERVAALVSLFEASGIRCVVREDMEKAIWEKFVCNVSENQVSAVLGLPFGAWGDSDHANDLRLMAAKEVVAIAEKKGIHIPEDYAPDHRKSLMRHPKGNKASTLQDIENGRKTEVEMFAGTVIRLGKEYGVPTPVNEFLYHAIRVLEEKNEGKFEY